MPFTEKQLQIIDEINNITPGKCSDKCVDTCRFASFIAARILFDNNLDLNPSEANGCQNYSEIQDKVEALQKLLDAGNSTTE